MIYPTLTQTTTSMTSSAVSPAAAVVVGEAAVSQLFDDHTQVHHGVTLNQLTIGIAGMACLVVYLVRLPARLLSTASHTGATVAAPVDTTTSSSEHGHTSVNGHASVNAAANGSPNQATGDSGSIVEKEKLINGVETKVDLNTSSVSVVWV